jgi:hypothetical protein
MFAILAVSSLEQFAIALAGPHQQRLTRFLNAPCNRCVNPSVDGSNGGPARANGKGTSRRLDTASAGDVISLPFGVLLRRPSTFWLHSCGRNRGVSISPARRTIPDVVA